MIAFVIRNFIPALSLLFVSLVLAVLANAERAAAFSFDVALDRCRQTVGKPLVQACLGRQWDRSNSHDLAVCRNRARPYVRICVRRAMIAAFGRSKVEQTIERCRQAVGRPIVRACVDQRGSGNPSAQLEACRVRARPHVRACVRRTIQSIRGGAISGGFTGEPR